jgi:nucleoside-diphosphate-sugar epimerase
MRIAVTGASGFVGQALLRAARGAGWEAVGVARSEESARQVAAAGGQPARAGLAAAELAPAFEDAQVVVHLAQIGSEKPGRTFEGVNVEGTRQVVEGARQAGVPRLVYFSGLGVARYGLAPRCTDGYFLSKLSAEVLLYSSDREAVVFRPSYIVGPGDGLVRSLLAEMAAGVVEWPGDGQYRLQPIALADAAAAILAAASLTLGPDRRQRHRVVDLVGPSPVTYQGFVERLARVARAAGRPARFELRSIPVEVADLQAAAGGYRGMPREELDCLLCDEVSDPEPLTSLLGRRLEPLDDALAVAVGPSPS